MPVRSSNALADRAIMRIGIGMLVQQQLDRLAAIGLPVEIAAIARDTADAKPALAAAPAMPSLAAPSSRSRRLMRLAA